MSLQSIIQERPEVRQGFALRLRRPRATLAGGLKAPPTTANYEMVAGAFGYLLGFLLERLNPQTRAAQWPAERGVEIIQLGEAKGAEVTTQSGYSRALKAAAYLADAKRQYRAYLQVGRFTDDLLVAAHRLAHLGAATRAGRNTVDWSSINYLGPDDAMDLRALLALVAEKTFRTDRACILKPPLFADALVGGADTGLMVDDCLMNVTLTKDPKIDMREYCTLVASWLLLGLGGIRREDESVEQLPVSSIGVYFARFGQLWKVPIDQIMPADVLPDVTRWFVETACAANAGARETRLTLKGPLAAFL